MHKLLLISLLLFSIEANAKVVKVEEDHDSIEGLIELSEYLQEEIENNDKREYNFLGQKELCYVFDALFNCRNESGVYTIFQAIPAFPPSLIHDIADQSKPDTQPVITKQFWEKISKYEILHSSQKLRPINVEWARSPFYHWERTDQSNRARAALNILKQIYSKDGWTSSKDFFIADVKHKQNKKITGSIQFCWFSHEHNDPFAPKCHAVLAQYNGHTYIRFFSGFYNGGYTFIQTKTVICDLKQNSGIFSKKSVKHVKSDVVKMFTSPPHNMTARKRIAIAENAKSASFILEKEYLPSVWFPPNREKAELAVSIQEHKKKPSRYLYRYSIRTIATKCRCCGTNENTKY